MQLQNNIETLEINGRKIYKIDVGSMSIGDAEKTVNHYMKLFGKENPKNNSPWLVKFMEFFGSTGSYSNPFTSHAE